MREIKFRAWNLDQKWMDDFFFVSSNGIAYDTPSKTYDTPNTEIEENPSLIIMQLTGLKDKNGVDIYEGDLLSIRGWIGYVYYKKVNGRFDINEINNGIHYAMAHKFIQGEVIGNIYENKDLIEANK